MNTCQIPVALAYFLAIYTFGSIFYLIATRSIGTPFYNSLNEEQLRIKQKAVSDRKRIFYYGLFIASIILFIWKPFKSCDCK